MNAEVKARSHISGPNIHLYFSAILSLFNAADLFVLFTVKTVKLMKLIKGRKHFNKMEHSISQLNAPHANAVE